MARKKRKMTKAQIKKSHTLAKKLKGKKGIRTPYALANWLIKKGKKNKKKRK